MRFLAIATALILLALAAPAAPAGQVAMSPPPPGSQSRQCLDCHRQANLATNEGALANRAFCLECHGQKACTGKVKGVTVPLFVDQDKFQGSRHLYVACSQCHHQVARSPHRQGTPGAQCRSCHAPHGEAEIHDPHLRVSCQACHHQSSLVRRDAASGLVVLARLGPDKKPLDLADHSRPDLEGDKFCQRCHYRGNPVQAPASVLPAKGMICFMCHPASLSIGSGWFGLALLFLLAGLAYLVWFWLRGSVQGESDSLHQKLAQGAERAWRTTFSREFWSILGAVVFDVILGRRLLMESVRRWLVHSLIFLSILARMALGVFTWLAHLLAPQSWLAQALLDKNQPAVAFCNDLLGLFILLGVVLALIQRFVVKPDYALRQAQDTVALVLLFLMVGMGFVLEGARLVISQVPAQSAVYAFVGYPLARLWQALSGDVAGWYDTLWWTHAILAAVFVAYLPFGKMRHMFATPLSLIMNRKLA